MADPKQVLRILDLRGIDVRLEAGRLIARPRQGYLPDDMRAFIRHFRDLIIAELEAGRCAHVPMEMQTTDRTETLSQRLSDGWAMCQAEANPERRASLEAHWLQLLAEYEDACLTTETQEGRAA